MTDKGDLYIVGEVGIFGELNIKDPTVTTVKKKRKDIDALIEEAIKENQENLDQ